jgi:glutathione S-transferase
VTVVLDSWAILRYLEDAGPTASDAFAAATAVARRAVLWTGNPELLVDAAAWQWRDLRR